MSVHLEIAIHRLKKSLLSLAGFVEEQVKNSLTAYVERNEDLAGTIATNDLKIDQMELDIEEDCLQILALYQPVAFDLRFVVSVLKINNDLERIGDLAVNIAERCISLCRQPSLKSTIDYSEMAEKATDMLKGSIDAFIGSDAEKARTICEADIEIDKMHQANYKKVETLILAHPQDCGIIIQLISLSRYLERIADLATNIAEDVVYLVEGKIVRHRERARIVNH